MAPLVCAFVTFLCFSLTAQAQDAWGDLQQGRYSVGFRLLELQDLSRSSRNLETDTVKTRKLRVYLWYPSSESADELLTLGDYLQFCGEEGPAGPKGRFVPVQLAQGFSVERQLEIRRLKTRAGRYPKPGVGRFPIIVVGQGLYYESPVTHVILCEYLASHGYLVATTPLTGTQAKLTHLSIPDLETQIRDMEFTLARAAELPFADPNKIAVIGYDLGGMSGLVLSMRNPGVSALLSLDSGILYPHSSGLPGSHPSYDERRFNRAWMHITQDRFVHVSEDSTLTRKGYGDSYLARVAVSNHAAFTLYAHLGIQKPVPAFWGEPEPQLRETYASICNLARIFVDGYVKEDAKAIQSLRTLASNPTPIAHKIQLEFKPGRPESAASEDEIIDLIINRGFAAAKPFVDRQLARPDGQHAFSEKSLTWLGYHFLYWWGRPAEAIDVFALVVHLFPESPDACNGYGETLLANDQNEAALQAFTRCLELDPGNEYAQKMLAQLKPTPEAKPQ